jgi:tRNA-2-methylthio-N6-dimethylallyladenosine synthase
LKKVYIETYGCQMNASDSEIVSGLLDGPDILMTDDIHEADVILVNTCSIRENAEERIYGRLGYFKHIKAERPEVVVGILGCMAERLRDRLTGDRARGVGQVVDLVVGPDEYRKVPELLEKAWHGEKGIAVRLSRVETYDDLVPLRTGGLSAWITIMRGCDKFCTFCVVPFTRGRERSRTLAGIVAEVEALARRGFREATLLGQNVNSWTDAGHDFADLLEAVASVDTTMRIRFTTSHPQDMSPRLIDAIARRDNICKYVHLPVQSGSDRILGLMNRTYDSAGYLSLIERLRGAIPGVSLSTDVIVGFPTESDDDHLRTMDLMERVGYDGAFMFKYSPREHTPAYAMGDDVPDEVKVERLNGIIAMQNRVSLGRNSRLVGSSVDILVEGPSKKSDRQMQGRTDGNKMVIVEDGDGLVGRLIGKIVPARIVRANSATLFGELDAVDGAGPSHTELKEAICHT